MRADTVDAPICFTAEVGTSDLRTTVGGPSLLPVKEVRVLDGAAGTVAVGGALLVDSGTGAFVSGATVETLALFGVRVVGTAAALDTLAPFGVGAVGATAGAVVGRRSSTVATGGGQPPRVSGDEDLAAR